MEMNMARFTVEHMLDELRTILLFEADHVLMGAGPQMAEQFIGFPTGDDHQYCFEPATKVDLDRFQITGTFMRGYDMAFRPSVLNSFDGSEAQDLIVFMLGTPRAGGISAGGETHRFMTPDGYCQMVADAVFARWKLEWEEAGAGSNTFTTRELALLSNMTEGAVRNALADRSENGLKAMPGSKPVSVEHDEAWRWLIGRRGFIPTPNRPSEDRFLPDHIRELQSSERLGRLVAIRLRDTFGSPQQAQAALGWSPEEIECWRNGSFEFDAERARQLAQALEFDVPLFVGKALEISLRRDQSATGVQ
jgi:hypothetical protein